MPVINIGGQRVNYSDSGGGVPIVFIPGLSGSAEWFCYQASGLADHYRVLSYDLRRARGSEYSLEILVEDLAGFLRAVRVHCAVVAGHSFGGLVALRFAAEHPQSCLALVLASALPCYPAVPREELLAALVPGEVNTDSLPARLWKRIRRVASPTEQSASPLDPLARLTRQVDRRTLDARLALLRTADLSPVLEEVAMPVLLVAGSAEKPYVLSGVQLMDQRIADSTLEVIEDSDQYYFYTKHDVFNGIIADYLAHNIARP